MTRKPMKKLIGHLVTVSSYCTPLENREISHASNYAQLGLRSLLARQSGPKQST